MGLRTWLGLKAPKPKDYWEKRKNMRYYQEVRALAHQVAPNPRSIIDVGSNGCPYLDWFDAEDKLSVDLKKPYAAPDVDAVIADFLEWPLPRRFDLCLCLQVLEHVPDATPFARKLLRAADHVVVSVPYKWPAGVSKNHVHDPVDEAKMRIWFGREPDQSTIVTEERPGRCSRRMICYYRTA